MHTPTRACVAERRGRTGASENDKLRLLERHERKCYGCGRNLNSQDDFGVKLGKSRPLGGKDEFDNWIPVCNQSCNKRDESITIRCPEWLFQRIDRRTAVMWEGEESVRQRFFRHATIKALSIDPEYTHEHALLVEIALEEGVAEATLDRKLGLNMGMLDNLRKEANNILDSLSALNVGTKQIQKLLYDEFLHQNQPAIEAIDKEMKEAGASVELPPDFNLEE